MAKERNRLTNLVGKEIFEPYPKSDEYRMIFTYKAFDSKTDWDYINNLEDLFTSIGAEIYYVELAEDFDLVIKQNKTKQNQKQI